MYKAVIFALILPAFSVLTACNSSSDSPAPTEKEAPKTEAKTEKPTAPVASEEQPKETPAEKPSAEKETPTKKTTEAEDGSIDFSAINAVVQEGMTDAPSAEEAEKPEEKAAEPEKTLDVEKLQKAADNAEIQIQDSELRNSLSSIVGEAMEDQEFKE